MLKIIHTLASPIYSLRDLNNASRIKQQINDSAPLFYATYCPKMNPANITPKEQLSKPLLEKINHFVKTELNLDPDEFVFLKGSTGNSAAGASGTLRQGCRGIILFSSELARQMEIDFNDEHKFAIAHEISHLLNGDDCEKTANQQIHTAKFHLGIYFLMLFATSFFLSYPAAHFASIGGAGVVKEMRSRQLLRSKETQADLRAAKFSTEIAKGGIKLLEKDREAFEQTRVETIEGLSKIDRALAEQEPSCWKRSTRRCFTKSLIRIAKLFPVELFCNLKDRVHPLPRHRIAAIQQVLQGR